MDNEIIGKIQLEGGKKASVELQQLQKDVDGFNKELRKNNDAVRLLDQLTGGAISQFRTFSSGITQGVKALTGFNKGLGLTKKALIATGIGAFVVLLGTAVVYWDEIVGFITGATAEAKKLREEQERTDELLTDEIGLIKQQIRLQELKGESTDETLTTLRKTLVIQQNLTKERLEQRILDLQKQKADDAELGVVDYLKIGYASIFGIKEAILKTAELTTDSSDEQKEIVDEINDLKAKTLNIDTQLATIDNESVKREKKKLDLIKEQNAERLKAVQEEIKLQERVDDAINVEDKRQKERDAINKQYDDLLFDLIMADELSTETELALNEARRQKLQEQQEGFDEEDNEKKQKIKDQEIANAQEILDAEEALQEKERQFADKSLDNLARIAGEETKLGKAALVAKQLIAAKAFLIDIGALKNKATIVQAESNLTAAKGGESISAGFAETLKLGLPAAIPGLIAYAITAAGIIGAIMSAVRSTKKVAASVGGTGGGGTPSVEKPTAVAPAFNIVGQSDTSQLTETITGQSQEPIQAFVVSNDVTTAQSLDRNIVQGATI